MIYQVYRFGNYVGVIPRWVYQNPLRFEYEYLSIYRGPFSNHVGAVMLPLNLLDLH